MLLTHKVSGATALYFTLFLPPQISTCLCYTLYSTLCIITREYYKFILMSRITLLSLSQPCTLKVIHIYVHISLYNYEKKIKFALF